MYTFTNKFGAVPVKISTKSKPQAKTYTRNTDPCPKRTETASDVVEMVEITVSTTTDDTLTMDNPINTTGMMDTEKALFDFTSPLNTATDTEEMIVANVNVPILDTSLLINAHVESTNEKFEFFTDVVEDELMNHLPDEGYSTSGSCSGKSSPTGSVEEENYVTLQNIDAENTMTNLNGIILSEMNLDSMLKEMDFNLLVDDHQAIKHDQERDQVLEKEQDPDWIPEGSSYVGTFKTLDDLVTSLGVEVTEAPKESARHKKGPKRQPLEALPKANISNVIRCREYREKKNMKYEKELTELESLEATNNELQMKEKAMRDQLSKMQGAYLKLITDGRIKFI